MSRRTWTDLAGGLGALALSVLLPACGGEGGGGGKDLQDLAEDRVAAPEVAAEIPREDRLPGDTLLADAGGQVPWGHEARGWTEVRGIVHLHSAYSHDGCSTEGWEGPGSGEPDPQCLDELRAAPCTVGTDFQMLTDHPSHGADVPYEQAIQHRPEEGDELLLDDQERPFANRVSCPPGSLVEDSFFFFGAEGSKQMPLALAAPVPPEIFHTSFAESTPLEDAQAAIALVHAQGGYAAAAHTEESSIPEERIVALPLDVMEIYNAHVGFLTGMDDIDSLLGFDAFMTPGTGRNPDLSFLLIFKPIEENVRKFDYAAARTDIAIIGACDIHRNVEIPALCPGGGGLCEPLEEEYPDFAALLQTGGPVPLSDGDRVDSYARSFRWYTNRAWVATRDAAAIRDAVGRGRGYVVFDLLGEPVGFDLFVDTGAGILEMGDRRASAGPVTVRLRTPVLGPQRWAPGSTLEFGEASVRTRLLRLTEDGPEILEELSGQGETLALSVEGPCALRAEIEVTPRHLAPELPGMEHLSDESYPYLYSNAIFLY